MHIRTKSLLYGLLTAIILSITIFAWFKHAGSVTPKELQLISLKPLPSQIKSDYGHERVVGPREPDVVSEKIAQSLIAQLKRRGKDGNEFAESLATCSAIHASKMQGDKSSCFNEYSGEAEPSCLIKQGYGSKSFGQILTADRFDLNGDGIRDYIITDRYYCGYISANQAQVYFVMLSKSRDDFRLAYADWTSPSIRVVIDPESGKMVLIEGIEKASGNYSHIFTFMDGQYISGRCVVEDEQGIYYCDKKK